MATRLPRPESPSGPEPSETTATDGGPAVVITPMRRRHLRGVLRIEGQVYARPWSMGLFLGELAAPDGRCYLVARVGASVVGYAGLMGVLDDGHITNVAVDPAWHRHGIATRLMLCLTRRAIAMDVANLTLEVRMSNAGAQSLYQRFGFVPAGVRRGYYVDTGEDAMVMWAHGIGSDAHLERLAVLERSVRGTTELVGFDR